MKTIFTKEKQGLIILLAVILSIPSFGKTKHIVEVSDSKFTPKNLTIAVGDTVEWQNIEGFHNVNGTKTSYPSNPVSFGNSTGTGWTYSYIFMTQGNYSYRCDEHFSHGMTGTITVETVTSSKYDLVALSTKVFPNPAREKVFIEPEGFSSSKVLVEIYNIAGKVEFSEIRSTEKRMEINTNQMVKGIYFVKLSDKSNEQIFKLIKN